MSKLTQAQRDCKRCGTERCICDTKRRKCSGATRHSNVPEGIEHVRSIGERQKPRSQWAFKPANGDVVGKQATRAERRALRRRYLQERPHDGKPDRFPK